MKITLDNFFNNYIIHPFAKELNNTQKAVAVVSSGLFFVASLGTLHTRAYFNEKKVEQQPQNPRTRGIVEKHLSGSYSEEESTVVRERKSSHEDLEGDMARSWLEEEVKIKPEPKIEPVPIVENKNKFAESLSSKQKSLYASLPQVEKDLYKTLYEFKPAGENAKILADLLLLLVKGKVKSFKLEGNDVTIDLVQGPVDRSLLGNNLTAVLPRQMRATLEPEKNRIEFFNEIPFSLGPLYILTPKNANLGGQGVKINAELSLAAKVSGKGKVLENYLTSEDVFNLFT